MAASLAAAHGRLRRMCEDRKARSGRVTGLRIRVDTGPVYEHGRQQRALLPAFPDLRALGSRARRLWVASCRCNPVHDPPSKWRSEEHTSELQSLMRISYAVFCLKKQTHLTNNHSTHIPIQHYRIN